jgi:pimeloyl-ACP methyl ester carboxylesterase
MTVESAGGLVFAAFLVLLISPQGGARAEAGLAPPYFEPGACPFPATGGAECGTLTVLENRDSPDGRRVRLPVVIFRSYSENPEPDPVVFFDGGPGNSVLSLAGLFAGSPIRRNRDLILLEQRGNDGAEPSLDCPEVDRALMENISSADGAEAEIARVAAAAGECRRRLVEEEGIDLSMYHSVPTAADYEDLRRVLGIERWNLYGVSYGTRLAMFYLRDYPASVRSVVLDSFYPPEVDTYEQLVPQTEEILDVVFDACAQDPLCRAAYPDLEDHFRRLIGRLNAEPILLRVGGIDVAFSGDDLVASVFNALYDASAVPLIPFLIEEVYRGHSGVLLPVSSIAVGQLLGINWGKYYSVECYEEWPFNSPEAVAGSLSLNPQLPLVIPFAYDMGVCPVWDSGRAPAAADQPVAGDAPVLILSGEFDPVTRPEFGRKAMESLSRAYRYEFTGLAHAVSLGGCPQRMMLDFIDEPDLPPDDSCAADLRRAAFIVAEDWRLTPALYRLNTEFLGQPNSLQLGLLGFTLVFFLGEVLLLPGNLIRMLRRTGRPSPAAARTARGLGLTAAVLGVAFWIGLVLAVRRTFEAGFVMLGFGVPAAFGWLFFIPWLAVLPAAGMTVLLIPAWRRGYWSTVERIHYTLLTLAALGFVFFTWYWGLTG